jgi:hypothetical protein
VVVEEKAMGCGENQKRTNKDKKIRRKHMKINSGANDWEVWKEQIKKKNREKSRKCPCLRG